LIPLVQHKHMPNHIYEKTNNFIDTLTARSNVWNVTYFAFFYRSFTFDFYRILTWGSFFCLHNNTFAAATANRDEYPDIFRISRKWRKDETFYIYRVLLSKNIGRCIYRNSQSFLGYFLSRPQINSTVRFCRHSIFIENNKNHVYRCTIKAIVMIKVLSSVVLFALAYSVIFNYFAYFESKIESESIGQK
jgi:hypothetical protein